MSLLNTRTGYTTPWHCTVAQLADGEWISAPMSEFKKDPRLELVYEDGRPFYFKEKVSDAHTPRISETSASYLQAPKQVSGYFSGRSSPGIDSGISVSSTPGSTSPRLTADKDIPTKELSTSNTNDPTSIPYGKRLIPQIMDSLAAAKPDLTVFSIATKSGDGLNFRDISAREFTSAVDKTAWWLRSQVGTPSSIQPVGYIGPRKFEKRLKPNPFLLVRALTR